MSFTQTHSGGKVWAQDCIFDELTIEDVAHSLSNLCRFNGHTIKFYSVAEHCWLLAHWAYRTTEDKSLAYAALMHDCCEAIIGDVPQPIKKSLMDFSVLEERILKAMAEKFEFSYPLPSIIMEADRRIVINERHALMTPTPDDWGMGDIEPLDRVFVEGHDPEVAKVLFELAHKEFAP
jgi:hypothetical protein